MAKKKRNDVKEKGEALQSIQTKKERAQKLREKDEKEKKEKEEKELIKKQKKEEEIKRSREDDDDSLPRGKKPKVNTDNGEDNKSKKKITNEEDSTKDDLFKSKSKSSAKDIKALTPLSYKTGMLTLGSVKRVNETSLDILLPHMEGKVLITEISDILTKLIEENQEDEDSNYENIPQLSDLYKVGDIVRCAVLQNNNKKVTLSLKCEYINGDLDFETVPINSLINGVIASEEDKGYIVSLGGNFDEKCKAFLLKTEVGTKSPAQLVVGAPIEAIVKSKKYNTISLTLEPKMISSGTVANNTVGSINQLKPGMLVDGVIEKILTNGIYVSFLKTFEGGVRSQYLNKDLDSYSQGQNLKLRILNIDYDTKMIYLCQKSHLLKYSGFSFDQLTIGQILKQCEVTGITTKAMTLLSQDAKYNIIVNNNNVDDSITQPETVMNKYKIGLKLDTRIVSFDSLDGVVHGNTKKSFLKQQIVGISDVHAGMIINGEVQSIKPNFIVVKVSDGIYGKIGEHHMSDVPVHKDSDPTKKFKVGQSIKCRVIAVEVEKSRLILSAKPTLLSSPLKIVDYYDDLMPGDLAHGVVSNITEFGCFVEFYNGVTGLVPLRYLSSDEKVNQNPSAYFKKGQIVKCKVIRSDPEERRLSISLILTNDKVKVEKEENSKNSQSDLIGKLFSGQVRNSYPGSILVKLSNEKLVTIQNYHLSDFDSHYESLKNLYTKGKKISEILILSGDENKGYLGSLKPSLINACKTGSLLSDTKDINPGVTYDGYISRVSDYGVFVSFLKSFHVLVPTSKMGDIRITNVSEVFNYGQSVRVRKVEENEKGSVCSMLSSDLEEENSLNIIESYFKEEEQIGAKNVKENLSSVDWNKYSIGNEVDAIVSVVDDSGVLFKFEDQEGLSGYWKKTKNPDEDDDKEDDDDVDCEEGKVMTVKILDINKEDGIVDVSISPRLLSEDKSFDLSKAQKDLKKLAVKSDNISVTIEMIKEDYLVLSFNDGLIGFALKSDLNHLHFPVDFTENDKYHLLNHPKSLTDRIFLTRLSSTEKSKKSNKVLHSVASMDELKVGLLIHGIIKKIEQYKMVVQLGYKIFGEVFVTDVSDDKIELGKNSFEKFKIGDRVHVKVMKITQKKPTPVISLSMKTSDLGFSQAFPQEKAVKREREDENEDKNEDDNEDESEAKHISEVAKKGKKQKKSNNQ